MCEILTAGGGGFNIAKNEGFSQTDGRTEGGEQIRLFVFRLTSITQTRLPPHHILVPAGAPLSLRLRLAHSQRAAELAERRERPATTHHLLYVNALEHKLMASGQKEKFSSWKTEILMNLEDLVDLLLAAIIMSYNCCCCCYHYHYMSLPLSPRHQNPSFDIIKCLFG